MAKTLKHVRAIDYDTPTTIAPGLAVTLRDAGHILGSASVELVEQAAHATDAERHEGDARDRVLVFSGDIGTKGTPILRDPAPVPRADLVLLESTYGGRLHRERAATVAELGAVFREAWRDRGCVVIPAFAVGRTQELLYWFAQHFDDWGLSRWRVFLDSPMAARVLGVYERHAELFDEEAKRVWAKNPNPLRLPNLHLAESTEDSMAINRIESGAIIIAGSGMANGGRVRHHLRHRLPFERNHVMFVGYQAAGTLGRRLVDGAPMCASSATTCRCGPSATRWAGCRPMPTKRGCSTGTRAFPVRRRPCWCMARTMRARSSRANCGVASTPMSNCRGRRWRERWGASGRTHRPAPEGRPQAASSVSARSLR